ncbi:MAG: PIN domain-containing protein [Actinobacteria bacterium]|nr:PIN domain-containing protein [Cyanobacteriota bacterium]MCL5771824.1 PIN domain-containing protein [Actinomycetota bacterium]
MKIFLDTNVILDVLVKREPFYIDSAKILTLVNEKIIPGYVSAITINNIYYILNKLKNREVARNFIKEIIESFEIIPLTKIILQRANKLDIDDFEDAIQYFSALEYECDFLLTRNYKDYPEGKINRISNIKVITSSELIKLL